jgi:hypothetical protein
MPYYFFFALLGLMIGALLTWFFLADHPFESLEAPGGPVDEVEAGLLHREMVADGYAIEETTIVRLLHLHGNYVDGKIREAQAAADAARIEAAANAEAAAANATADAAPQPAAPDAGAGDAG